MLDNVVCQRIGVAYGGVNADLDVLVFLDDACYPDRYRALQQLFLVKLAYKREPAVCAFFVSVAGRHDVKGLAANVLVRESHFVNALSLAYLVGDVAVLLGGDYAKLVKRLG